VIVENRGKRLALLVDELLGQQQVVIKSLETNFRKVEGAAGATILGDGQPALILDVAAIAEMARFFCS
jgi:two-component system chemotaxis sensor kinase CheA